MRWARISLVAIFGLLLTSCYEEPVREHVHIHFFATGQTALIAMEEASLPNPAPSNRRIQARVEEAQSEMDLGLDRWYRHIRKMNADADSRTVQRIDGKVRRAVTGAISNRFEDIAEIMALEGLAANLRTADGISQLEFSPGAATRATQSQRQTLDQALNLWAARVAEYLGVTEKLYVYLDGHPDRAATCFANIFERATEDMPALDEREEEMVKNAKEACKRVTKALSISDDESASLNELSRLVFDPLPVRLTVSTSGEIVGVEGLIMHKGYAERPRLDLWSALIALEGRWIAPDLVTAMAAPAPEAEQPKMDPEAFALIPRRHSAAPDSTEVATALRQRLTPPNLYVLRWQSPPPTSDEEKANLSDALALLESVTARVPK